MPSNNAAESVVKYIGRNPMRFYKPPTKAWLRFQHANPEFTQLEPVAFSDLDLQNKSSDITDEELRELGLTSPEELRFDRAKAENWKEDEFPIVEKKDGKYRIVNGLKRLYALMHDDEIYGGAMLPVRKESRLEAGLRKGFGGK